MNLGIVTKVNLSDSVDIELHVIFTVDVSKTIHLDTQHTHVQACGTLSKICFVGDDILL